MNNQKTITNKLVQIPLIMLLALTTGCASRSPISQLAHGEEISIQAKTYKEEKNVKVSNQQLGESTAEIGGGSAALMAVVGGLACGPLFIICSSAGMLAGGIAGTAIGLVVGVSADLDDTTKKTISDKFTLAIQNKELAMHLENEMKTRSQRVFDISENESATNLILSLKSIRLHSYEEGVALYVRVHAELEYMDDKEKKQTKEDIFNYTSQPFHVNSWVIADDVFYEEVFSTAFYHLSEQVVLNLLDARKPSRVTQVQ